MDVGYFLQFPLQSLHVMCRADGINYHGLNSYQLATALHKHDRISYLKLKQEREKRERKKRAAEQRAREQEIRCNNQCKTLFAMYEAMDHPEVNNYADDVHCNASRFVDDVFDVMLCDNARVMSCLLYTSPSPRD